MANTSAQFVLQTLSDILSYKNGTGSVNFYMAHGGSNFGYWAGAQVSHCFRQECLSDDTQWPRSEVHISAVSECERDFSETYLVHSRAGARVAMLRAGANMAGQIYQPHITSYDYDCPISEAGGIGQPGIGGDNKFKVRQDPCILHKIASLPANADCGTPVSCRKDSFMSMF